MAAAPNRATLAHGTGPSCGFASTHRVSDAGVAAVLGAALLAVYLSGGDYYPIGDATPSALQAVSLLEDGNLSFTSDEVPERLIWKLHAPGGMRIVPVTYVDDEVAQALAAGRLTIEDVHYSISPTTREGVYLNTFSPGAALTAVPVFAVLKAAQGSLLEPPERLWFAGKWAAALCVAISAAVVYLTARRWLELGPAVALALVYGLGTGVWSTSSQALWQHGPNAMYLALGTYWLPVARRQLGAAALCAIAYAAATWCRPTGALVVAAVAFYLLLVNWRACVIYVLTGLPLGIALLAYNAYYFGSPLAFGQTGLVAHALEKTGSEEIWQTPLLVGLVGLLVSPSRGLFVFSPVLLVGLWGGWLCWRRPELTSLRPLTVAVVAIWCVEARHFDWWGGWSYGYRHIVDTAPLLAVLAVGAVRVIAARGWLTALMLPLIAWSVVVQAAGAYAFDLGGWNARARYIVTLPNGDAPRITFDRDQALDWAQVPGSTIQRVQMNIDGAEYRDRLWSWRDWQIAYYLVHFAEARREKHRLAEEHSQPATERRMATHVALGRAWLELGEPDQAEVHFRRAQELAPSAGQPALALYALWSDQRQFDAAREVADAAVAQRSRDVGLRNELGLIDAAQGRIGWALVRFDQALALDRRAAEHDFRQRGVYLPGSTHDEPRLVTDTLPEIEWLRVDYIRRHYGEARAALATGDLEQADIAAQAACQFDTAIGRSWYLLGLVRVRQGAFDEAMEYLARATELMPDDPDPHLALGTLLTERGYIEAARRALTRAVELAPYNAVARRRLAALGP